LYVLAAHSGGAATEEEQGAFSALKMDSSFNFFDANRFELTGGLNNTDRVDIASANDWDDGREKSDFEMGLSDFNLSHPDDFGLGYPDFDLSHPDF
jgi:hypothetical protein